MVRLWTYKPLSAYSSTVKTVGSNQTVTRTGGGDPFDLFHVTKRGTIYDPAD